MESFAWKEKFSVHVDEMDNHHKKLLGYFTELEIQVQAGNATQKVGEVLKALTEYSRFHFAEEERLMKVIKHPGLDAQLLQHAYFSNEVEKMTRQFSMGNLPNRSLVCFLRDWFVNHIMSEDFKYGELIKRGDSES